MMTVLSVVIFMGAFAAAVAAIVLSVAPQWRRIVRLATGHVEQPFAPLSALALAERRIAVRRWAATSAPALRMRAAA
jgi:hypothetical protein